MVIRCGVIPEQYATFYNNLPASAGVKDQAVWLREFNPDDREENVDDPDRFQLYYYSAQSSVVNNF